MIIQHQKPLKDFCSPATHKPAKWYTSVSKTPQTAPRELVDYDYYLSNTYNNKGTLEYPPLCGTLVNCKL